MKHDLTVYKVPLFGTVQAGGVVRRFDLNYKVSAPNGLDNPYSATPNVKPFVLNSVFSAVQPEGYVQATRGMTSRLNVTLGGRFDDYDYIGRSRVSPRAALAYRLPLHLVWSGSYGLYYQQAPFLFLSAFLQIATFCRLERSTSPLASATRPPQPQSSVLSSTRRITATMLSERMAPLSIRSRWVSAYHSWV